MVIGGEGSLTGALRPGELGVAVVGIPATIDNDVPGTEVSHRGGHGFEHRARGH